MEMVPQAEESIFAGALKIQSPDERNAYLETVCGGDTELRSRVDALLRRHEEAEGMLDVAPPGVGTTPEPWPNQETIGTLIDRYKLLELVGEGGFGSVYLAEQQKPIARKVALKIIRLGMDTERVIARFEAERQALALMDHPNIAKVLDAGATEGGRPYFVMELVRGRPITEYCDAAGRASHAGPGASDSADRTSPEARTQIPKDPSTQRSEGLASIQTEPGGLTIRERLMVFLDVCRAVQHAHQKGVIHRDLKPTNILVESPPDGKPLVKIIDFGIAKATQQRLTEQTLATETGQLLGTPEYMSPEQATFQDADVDTRSDIYSLGVLLFELLVGTTPFDGQALRQLGYDEICRTIRQSEPLPPSRRLSRLGEAAQEVARQRQVQVPALERLLRRELDWIVMKCLEKDRARRYETVSDLARDIERYLANEPVLARPASITYRLKKFVQKNRVGVVSGVAVLLALSLGMAWAIIERGRAREHLYRGCELVELALVPTYDELEVPADSERREARDRLLAHSIQFFESLDEEALRDPRVRHGLGRANGALARFRFYAGKDSLRPAHYAIALLTPLVRQYPSDRTYLESLGSVYEDLGIAYWAAGRRMRSVLETGKGVAIARQTFANDSTRANILSSLYGFFLHENGKYAHPQ